MTEKKSLTPNLPLYREATHFLRLLHGISVSLYRGMYNHIYEQRGNPQETIDWTDPDEWIPERLTGEEKDLAFYLWHQSNKELNPRYMRGCWYLSRKHNLLTENQVIFALTVQGQDFISGNNQTISEIDSYEGLLNVLQVISERAGKRSELLNDYANFCRTFTNYDSQIVINTSLYDRLVNLLDRKLIVRSGLVYSITELGLSHLEQNTNALVTSNPTAISKKQHDIVKIINILTQEARNRLHDYLSTMDPYKFEQLIKLLLEEMGYTDVIVTSPSNDKGVDVVANIQLGISSVREVVQVKRHKPNIQRKVLDELRGSLHRFDAVRATIITTGGFAKGTENAAFEKGAAPITLIDGGKLVDLLIEHEIGISKKTVHYLEFDPAKLSQFEIQESETNGGM